MLPMNPFPSIIIVKHVYLGVFVSDGIFLTILCFLIHFLQRKSNTGK